jgi:ketosteroid isomerase-like protein
MRDTFSRYAAAVESKDRQGLLAVLTEDVVQVDPYPSPANVGHEAVAAFFATSWSMADSLKVVPGRAVTGGDKGAFPFTIRTTVGDSTFEIDVIDVMAFAEDGRIREITAFVDMAGMRAI